MKIIVLTLYLYLHISDSLEKVKEYDAAMEYIIKAKDIILTNVGAALDIASNHHFDDNNLRSKHKKNILSIKKYYKK